VNPETVTLLALVIREVSHLASELVKLARERRHEPTVTERWERDRRSLRAKIPNAPVIGRDRPKGLRESRK
jgi:hypothetical protein